MASQSSLLQRARNGAHRFLHDRGGSSLLEYVILVSLVGLAALAAWKYFGSAVDQTIRCEAEAVEAGAAVCGNGDIDTEAPGPSNDDSAPNGGGESDPSRSGAGAIASGVVAGLGDVVGGMWDGVTDLAGGAWHVATHPAEVASSTADIVRDAIENPGETAKQAAAAAWNVGEGLVDSGVDLYGSCTSGDHFSCARGITNVAANFVPAGSLGTVARGASRIGRVAGGTRHARVAISQGRKIRQRFGDVADVVDDGRDARRVHRRHGGDREDRVVDSGSSEKGRALNLTSDRVFPVPETDDAFYVAGHADRGAMHLSADEVGNKRLMTRKVAQSMVDKGYRGGDVVLLGCESARTEIPVKLRTELNRELKRRKVDAKVGTIAAPTEAVDGFGIVDEPGHWRLFDADTTPWEN